MSDLLLSASNINQASMPPMHQDPLTQILNIVQNPMSMFSGFGGAGGSPFMPTGDFGGGGQLSPLEQLGLIALSAGQSADKIRASGQTDPSQQTEQPEAFPFPLPEEGVPKGDEPIADKYKNADGKTKSWQQIRDDSPVCKNFGGNAKDIEEIKKGAKEKFGDWENEKDPEKASRSYIKFRELLEYADNSKSNKGGDRGEEANNGNLNGLTKDGDIRDGTELSTVVNYFRHGRQFVADTTEGGVLKETKDKYVRQDGSTRSDAGQFFVDVGNALGHIPLLGTIGNSISGAADGIDRGAQKGDAGAAILGGLKGGFNGATHTIQTTFKGVTGLASGDLGSAFGAGASLLGMGESFTDTL